MEIPAAQRLAAVAERTVMKSLRWTASIRWHAATPKQVDKSARIYANERYNAARRVAELHQADRVGGSPARNHPDIESRTERTNR